MACSSLLSEEDLCRFRTKKCRRLSSGSCEFGIRRCQYSHNQYWSRRCPVYLSDRSCFRYIHMLCPHVTIEQHRNQLGELCCKHEFCRHLSNAIVVSRYAGSANFLVSMDKFSFAHSNASTDGLDGGIICFENAESEIILNSCSRGGECPYAHSMEEILYHPLFYKMVMCKDHQKGWCKAYYCPYIHGLAEARQPKQYKLPFTTGIAIPPLPFVTFVGKIHKVEGAGLPLGKRLPSTQTGRMQVRGDSDNSKLSRTKQRESPKRTPFNDNQRLLEDAVMIPIHKARETRSNENERISADHTLTVDEVKATVRKIEKRKPEVQVMCADAVRGTPDRVQGESDWRKMKTTAEGLWETEQSKSLEANSMSIPRLALHLRDNHAAKSNTVDKTSRDDELLIAKQDLNAQLTLPRVSKETVNLNATADVMSEVTHAHVVAGGPKMCSSDVVDIRNGYISQWRFKPLTLNSTVGEVSGNEGYNFSVLGDSTKESERARTSTGALRDSYLEDPRGRGKVHDKGQEMTNDCSYDSLQHRTQYQHDAQNLLTPVSPKTSDFHTTLSKLQSFTLYQTKRFMRSQPYRSSSGGGTGSALSIAEKNRFKERRGIIPTALTSLPTTPSLSFDKPSSSQSLVQVSFMPTSRARRNAFQSLNSSDMTVHRRLGSLEELSSRNTQRGKQHYPSNIQISCFTSPVGSGTWIASKDNSQIESTPRTPLEELETKFEVLNGKQQKTVDHRASISNIDSKELCKSRFSDCISDSSKDEDGISSNVGSPHISESTRNEGDSNYIDVCEWQPTHNSIVGLKDATSQVRVGISSAKNVKRHALCTVPNTSATWPHREVADNREAGGELCHEERAKTPQTSEIYANMSNPDNATPEQEVETHEQGYQGLQNWEASYATLRTLSGCQNRRNGGPVKEYHLHRERTPETEKKSRIDLVELVLQRLKCAVKTLRQNKSSVSGEQWRRLQETTHELMQLTRCNSSLMDAGAC